MTHDERGALRSCVARCASLLDTHAPGWWLHGKYPPMVVARFLITRSRPLGDLEKAACGFGELDPDTADVVVNQWAEETERRRQHGTPIVELSDLERAAHEGGPAAHVRVQADTEDPEQAVWFKCEHCGQTRNLRSASPLDARREGHDFMLKHKRCPKPTRVLQ